MIKSKLFDNELQLNEFLNSYIKRSVVSIQRITKEVLSDVNLPGVPMYSHSRDFIELWYNSSEQETRPIPSEAHSLEVFAIKDSEDSPTGKEAYIGYKLANGDFHFIQVPYTENVKPKELYYVYEVEPQHQHMANGIVLGSFTSPEQASEAAVKWGYVGDNYFISPIEIKL